tara:strand:+ start:269 stop:481 length:213 start_codon:yes stop_codon:yes gene_type:complete
MAQVDEVHDFHGPYQVHVHTDGHVIVFLKNKGAYSLDSEKLSEIVHQEIMELKIQIEKWKSLEDRIKNSK